MPKVVMDGYFVLKLTSQDEKQHNGANAPALTGTYMFLSGLDARQK